jgi:mannose-6-phosphate isomerase
LNKTMQKNELVFSAEMPLKMESCRVWRTYTGGRLLEDWRCGHGEDGHFPEDWIGSTVRAHNIGRENIAEGYTMVAASFCGTEYRASLKEIVSGNPAAFLGESHYKKYGDQTGLLTKLLDSSLRLPIQAHPAKDAARRLFHSEYGKTEAWYVLGTRKLNGVAPYVLLGFKEGITKEDWFNVYKNQDIPQMLSMLHRINVERGDLFFVKSGVPHAIGEGCFLAEIQEPSDLVFRMEKTTPTGGALTDEVCTLGIGTEKMMEQFDYNAYSYEENLKNYKRIPELIEKNEKHTVELLIGKKVTPCFSLYRIDLDATTVSYTPKGFFTVLVDDGHGKLCCRMGETVLNKGETYFVPAGVRNISWESDSRLRLLICCPPNS